MGTRITERRPIGAIGRMSLVAAMHVGVVYLIADSLGMVPALIENRTEATIINEERIPDERVPMPQPRFERSDDIVRVPTPDLPPIVDEPDVINEPPPVIGEGHLTGSAVVEPVIVGVRQDARHPLSQPPYPPAEIRSGNTGTADIEVYVLPSGRVGDARIVKSTGYDALDRSALAEAKRNWKLLPATRDGVPIAQWHRLRVTFRLNRQ
jgi:periplasmic protein TonB